MVVRLLDGEGRFAWAAEFDGVKRMSVRPKLARTPPAPLWLDLERRGPQASDCSRRWHRAPLPGRTNPECHHGHGRLAPAVAPGPRRPLSTGRAGDG